MIQIVTPFVYIAAEEYEFPRFASVLKRLANRDDIMFRELSTEVPRAIYYVEGEEELVEELSKKYGNINCDVRIPS